MNGKKTELRAETRAVRAEARAVRAEARAVRGEARREGWKRNLRTLLSAPFIMAANLNILELYLTSFVRLNL